METLAATDRWLNKQHVITWCVSRDDELWCVNAFYVYDPGTAAFYLLGDEHTRHGQMTGERAKVASTVNSRPRTVALVRGMQFKGEIRRLNGDEEAWMRQHYVKRLLVARVLSTPVWGIHPDEVKLTDNTLGSGKKLHWRRDAGAEQTQRFAVEGRQIVRRFASDQLSAINHRLLVVKLAPGVFHIHHDGLHRRELTPADHIGADQQLRAMTDGKRQPPVVDEITGKGDEAFIPAQLVRGMVPGQQQGIKFARCDVISGPVDGHLRFSLSTLRRLVSLLSDRDDLMPGELERVGGRGKFRIFKIVGNEHDYLFTYASFVIWVVNEVIP